MSKCETCRFWDNSVTAVSVEDSGRCVVRAPTLPAYSTGIGAWPFTSADDHCGEHQAVKPDVVASLNLMAEAIAPFLAVANAASDETDMGADTMVQLDLADENGDPIDLEIADFLRLADAFARATGA